MKEKEKVRPIATRDNVAVWPLRHTQTQKKVYPISDGPKGERTYVNVFAQVGSYELTPQEALDIYCGDDLLVTLEGSHGPYEALLAKRGIKTGQHEGRDVYTLEIGVVLPVRRKSDNEVFGFKLDGVLYFKTVGSPSDPVQLTARDVLSIGNDMENSVTKDRWKISLCKIVVSEEGGRTNKTARLTLTLISEIALDIAALESADQSMPDLEEPEHNQVGTRYRRHG